MTQKLQLSCSCGRLRGAVTPVGPRTGTHIVCYCDDCQAFGRLLEGRGATAALDPLGGTAIFQTAPAHITLSEGADQLRCVRLSGKGMFRFYAGCCHAPIGNMMGPRMPFIGLITARLVVPEDGAASVARALGPATGVQGRYAIGGCPPGAARVATFGVVARSFGRVLGWWVGRKHQPSAFFDPATRRPRVEVEVLPAEAREELRGRVSAATHP